MEIIQLNLIPSGVNPTCHCSQYDEGREIRIELFDGSDPYTLASGDSVTLNVRKPDNTIVKASVSATQGNNYVDIITTEQICACVGFNLCDLTITNGNKVIGTLNFVMQIERDVLADGVPSQSVIEDLDALVEEVVSENYYNKSEVDSALALKADSENVYTKTEVDSALESKADASEVYSKTEVDEALAVKADSADVYTKTEIDESLDSKADKSSTYTKTEVDSALSSKANTDYVDSELALKADSEDVYIKTEIDSSLDLKADKSATYTKTEVDSALSNKANSSDVYQKSEVYNKTEVDESLDLKADSSDVYTKTEVDSELALKADADDVYTKAEIDAALALKIDKSEVYDLLPTDTAQGSVASFTDGANNLPCKSIICQINPTETGTGDKSPSNPYVIGGHTEINVTQTGVNIWDEEWEQGTFDNSTGEKKSYSNYWRSKNRIAVLPNTTYYAATSNDNIYRYYYDKSGNYIGNANGVNNQTFTTPNEAYYLNIVDVTRNSYDSSSKPVSINYPSTDTAYHAYNGQTHHADFGQTVYGGELNVTTGVLTITWGSVDLGSLRYNYFSAYTRFRTSAPITNVKSPINNNTIVNALVSIYGNNTYNATATDNNTFGVDTNGYLAIHDERYTDGTLLASALNGILLFYELATPITIQLDPIEVRTLLGANNMYHDCNGDTEVTFKADIGLYVDSKLG